MSCKIHIKVFEAQNVLNVDNVPSNPYVKFNLKGKPDSTVKTKTIYNTLNPSWDQELDIVSEDYQSDTLQICIYTENNSNDIPLTNVYEYPLRYRRIGEHFVFNDQIEKQKINAGTFHFELDFFIYPEMPFSKDKNPDQNDTQIDQISLQTDILALKKENDQIKAQFQNVANQNAQQISAIKEDLLALKKENEKLFQTLQEKSDTPIPSTIENSSNFFITDENFQTDEVLKDFAFSTLFKITDKASGRSICKRQLKMNKSTTTLKDVENVVDQFRVVHSMKHPCLSEAIGINTSEIVKSDTNDEMTTISLFFEFCPNSLKSALLKKMIDNTLKTKIVVEIAHALLFIHNRGLVFRDLSEEDVMLNSIFEAKIINFGLSRIEECVACDFSIEKSDGDVEYMSPELLSGKEYGPETDVFSFGALVFFIFCEKVPPKSGDNVREEAKEEMAEFGAMLVEKCMAEVPEERPTVEEIIKEMRSNKYALAADVDAAIIAKRDDELNKYD